MVRPHDGMTRRTPRDGRKLLNPQAGYGSCDDQLLDLRDPFEDRVGVAGLSGAFWAVP